jgi:hypothetical protein
MGLGDKKGQGRRAKGEGQTRWKELGTGNWALKNRDRGSELAIDYW